MSKTRFGKFWNFDPWWPQFWPEPKNNQIDFEMIFRELSNAAFRFSLRRPGAEIMGGGRSNAPPPPPSRRWEIQRPSRARVNIKIKRKIKKLLKFCVLKIKWPKSEEKVENGGRLGLTRQNFWPPPQNGPLDPPVNGWAGEEAPSCERGVHVRTYRCNSPLTCLV